MAHAVIIQLKLDPDSDREHRHSILNDFVVPEARALPGFEQGIWMNESAGTRHLRRRLRHGRSRNGCDRYPYTTRRSTDHQQWCSRGRDRGVGEDEVSHFTP
jgi:hypothetical protein